MFIHDVIRASLLDGVDSWRDYDAEPWERELWHALESDEPRIEATAPGGAEYTLDLLPAQEPVEYVEFDDLSADQPRGRKAAEYERLHRVRQLQDAALRYNAMKPIDPALVGFEQAHDVAVRWAMVSGSAERAREVQNDAVEAESQRQRGARVARKGRG